MPAEIDVAAVREKTTRVLPTVFDRELEDSRPGARAFEPLNFGLRAGQCVVAEEGLEPPTPGL